MNQSLHARLEKSTNIDNDRKTVCHRTSVDYWITQKTQKLLVQIPIVPAK